ncbi:amidohydrolase [Haloferax sp. DFSO52]|uniref:amidohydrolase n=1 Tax=Haloferax sp. DFSO52 TaxID=3388505 RepID=UPI003A8ACF43
MDDSVRTRLAELRRAFHRYPEPGWCEFWTTARLIEELREIGVDELAIGPDAYDPADRMAVPEDEVLDEWYDRALDRGADPAILEQVRGGNTGCVAVVELGDGPTVGLRVDIDGLYIDESAADGHTPADEGFRSETGETMHACGHDTHMTWGLATIDAIKRSDFSGRLVVFFQPAEEVSGGGAPMARSEYAADIDYFFAVHVGLDHPTGEVVAGIERPLAMCHIDVEIEGDSAHAGKAPEQGANAIQALGTAISNVYAIPRHSAGMTRVNVGRVEGGTASNIIAEDVEAIAEARGETTALMEYAKTELTKKFETAAEMHDCDATVEVVSESPRADSDPELVDVVARAAEDVDSVDRILPTADFGASEDATFLMKRVQEEGGLACYSIVGTDHPTSHHTPRFDVDERSLETGVSVLSNAIVSVSTDRP